MGSPHTCLSEAAVGAGHLRERGRVALDPSGRQIGHFRDLKLALILKVSFQNWLVSRILVAGSMCQIIPVRLVRFLYFRVFIPDRCHQHWFVSKLKLVSFKIGVAPTRRTVGSADQWV